MIFKLLNCAAVITVFVACFQASEAGPAYPGSTFNSWDSQQAAPQQQQQQRRAPPAQKNTLQNVVRQQIGDLDKQTQSDLKVLGYLEKELNKIFSCYIKLSCPRMRSPKVMSECQEIKDWPLYHQVMKMAGIRKYPYQSYAPSSSPHRLLATTELPELNIDDTTSVDDLFMDNGEDIFSSHNDQDEDYPPQRLNRQRSNRRVRRGSKHQHHHHHLNGVPVTNDDGQ